MASDGGKGKSTSVLFENKVPVLRSTSVYGVVGFGEPNRPTACGEGDDGGGGGGGREK